MAIHLQLTFPCNYQVEPLDRLPMLIEDPQQFVFPKDVEEVERGALIVRVRRQNEQRWIGTFAKGFDSETATTGLFSTPHPDWLCAVSGGYAYVVNAQHPEQWHFVKSRPVLETRAISEANALTFADFQTLSGFTADATLWQSAPLSWEGLKITAIKGNELQGFGWDAIQDRDVPFTVDLRTGQHTGGTAPKVAQYHRHMAG
jgi:hypothetical protein